MSGVKTNSIRKNYLFNLAYQVFSLITPLITAPYVSRVLGTSGVGQYGFTYSIASYIILIGSLGFTYYAQREVARLQGHKKEQSVLFWEIFHARFLSIGITTILYCLLIRLGLFGQYEKLMWILTIHIASTIFDITFLFQGNDAFGVIAIRNIIVRCIGIALIFIFVRNQNDVWIYVLCQSIITFFANISLWFNLKRNVDWIPFSELNIKRHIIPVIRLFIPSLAMSVYTILDRTLISVLISGTTDFIHNDGTAVVARIADIENGYYEQSEKIVKMAMTVFTALSTVMISRNSNEIANGNIEGFKNNIYNTIHFVVFLGVPIMFGIAAIAENLSPWFFGPGYDKVPSLIMIFSPVIIIIGLSNILGRQYLIPLKRDNAFTFAICIGAVSNLIMNLILIPIFFSFGAAIASVLAESAVTTSMLIMARQDISIEAVLKLTKKYFLAGVMMFVSIFSLQKFLSPSIINTILLIILGALIYFLLLLILKDSFFMIELKRVKSRIRK